MPYTGDPQNNLEDRARFYAGDTDVQQLRFSDKEVQFALSESGQDAKAAAYVLLKNLSRRYAGLADYREGPVAENLSQLSKAYAEQAEALMATGNAVPWAGGLSVSAKQERYLDTDAVRPFFRRGL